MAGADDIDILVRIKEAARARRELKSVSHEVTGIGTAARGAAAQARTMGGAVTAASSTARRGLGAVAGSAKYGAAGMGALAVATTKWGLGFNAQVESARLRFGLFTDDVDGLTRSVQKIDLNSQFDFGQLSDAAAMLGNANIKDVPNVLQGIANAAAASGGGGDALLGISRAIGQIGNKSRLSMEEVNQLSDQMAPGVWDAIRKRLGVTKDEMQNLGNEGIDGRKAIRALVDEWTSGRLETAAKRQTATLGGQWDLLTGNLRKASGAATFALAGALERDVLPAANRAAQAVTDIFSDDTLAPEDKLRRARAVISRELGPFVDDLGHMIDQADIPGHLGDAVGAALPKMAGAAAGAAPDVAKAFVDAWIHSGPWAQLLSALYVGGKLNKGRKALGIGGAATGVLGAASKARPVPVWVVNGGKDMPGGMDRWLKKYGPGGAGAAAATGAGIAAGAAGIVAAGEGSRYLAPRGQRKTGHIGTQTAPGNIVGGAGLAGLLGNLFGHHPAIAGPTPSGNVLRGETALGGFPLESRIRIDLDGKPVAHAVVRQRARQKARRAGRG